MIKKLRTKFILIAILSLFSVLAVIVSAANLISYKSIVSRCDDTLSLIVSGDGGFPQPMDKPEMPPKKDEKTDMRPVNPELPYSARFFSVTFEDQKIVSSKTDNIAALDKSEAEELAKRYFEKGKEKGFAQNYRYLRSSDGDTVTLIFLDCTEDISNFRTFLFASIGISAVCLCAVFFMILLLSERIIRPISESYEKQKTFITDAGHEIKTPLTIIDANAEVLEMEIGENEWLSDIRKQTKRLSLLTKKLIFLSKMDEGEKYLRPIEFPVSDMVAEAADSFKAPAKTKDLGYFADIEKGLTYCGDESALSELWNILLDNAVKYAPHKGNVWILLKKSGRWLHFEIANTADDLAVEDIPQYFERFRRAERSRNSELGGFGIGLSAARAIVSAHKGKIHAFSSDGRSFSVRVLLPL